MPSIFARIAAVLCESARLELISKQFGIPVETIEGFRSADPTNGKYLTWITKQVKLGQLRFPEDHEKVHAILSHFDQAKKSPKFTAPKDINQYARYGDLARTMLPLRGELFQSNKEKQRQAAASGMKALPKKIIGYRVNGKMSEATVYEVTTHEAMLALGARETEWCVKDPKYFDHYGPPFYMLVNDDDQQPMELLHLPSGQCMDKWDSPTDPSNFEAVGIDCFPTLTPNRMLGRLQDSSGDPKILAKILDLVVTPNSSVCPSEDSIYIAKKHGACFLADLRPYDPVAVDAAVLRWFDAAMKDQSLAFMSLLGTLAKYAEFVVQGRFEGFEQKFEQAWAIKAISYPRHMSIATNYSIGCLSKVEEWEWLSDTILEHVGAGKTLWPGASSLPWFEVAFWYFSHQNERCAELEEAWTNQLDQFKVSMSSDRWALGIGQLIAAYESTFKITLPK